jgi:hypothetical protein
MFGLAVILAGKTRLCVFKRPPRFPALLTRQERLRSAIYASRCHPPPWLARGFQNPPAGTWRQGRGGRPRRVAAPKPRANRRAPAAARGSSKGANRSLIGGDPRSAGPARTPLPGSLCAVCAGALPIHHVVAPRATRRHFSRPRCRWSCRAARIRRVGRSGSPRARSLQSSPTVERRGDSRPPRKWLSTRSAGRRGAVADQAAVI